MPLNDLGLLGYCVLAILAIWFLVSVLHQFDNEVGRRVKKANILGVIPGWTFFAPIPGTSDYRFVFRDVLPTGCTEWQEVQWCSRRRLLDAIWHPERHHTKLVVDCVSALVRTVAEMRKLGINQEGKTPAWIVSVPYLALLNIAVSTPRISSNAKARQFAIIEQKLGAPSESYQLIVCSSAHQM